MKISFAAIGVLFAANSQTVDASFFGKSLSPEEQAAKTRENTLWYAAGVKGYYTGFYKSFYKTDLPQDAVDCLNDETMDNVLNFQKMVTNPMSAVANVADIQKDVNIFTQMAEIMENMSTCHRRLMGQSYLRLPPPRREED